MTAPAQASEDLVPLLLELLLNLHQRGNLDDSERLALRTIIAIGHQINHPNKEE